MNNKILLIGIISSIIVTLVIGSYIGINYEINNSFEGTSMEPDLENGDLIITKSVDSIEEVNNDDIITFTQNNCDAIDNNIIHKVYGEVEEGLITKGTNVSYTDQSLNTDGEILENSCVKAVDDDMINSKVIYHSDDSELNSKIRTYINLFRFD